MASWHEVRISSPMFEGEIPDLNLEFKGAVYYEHVHGDGSAHLAKMVTPEPRYAWFRERGVPPAVVKVVCLDCNTVMEAGDQIEVIERRGSDLEIPSCPPCQFPLGMCQCF